MSISNRDDFFKYSDRNFVRVWPVSFSNAISGLGEGQFRFVLYLIRKCTKNNMINDSIEGLISKSGVSRDTVRSTLRNLVKNDFLRRIKPRCLMINPEVVFAGSDAARRIAICQYQKAAPNKAEVKSVSAVSSDDSDVVVFDSETGEILENASSDVYNGFLKLWPKKSEEALSGLGRKQLVFTMYLLSHIWPDNRVYGTKEQLAKRAGVSMDIAYSTIRILSARRFLCVESNIKIIINPDIVSYDTTHQRTSILEEFCKCVQKNKAS